MIGIYKIVSPTGKVYVGQAVEIEKRKKVYEKHSCKGQPRLYASLVKYGFSKHIFEVVEECRIEELNERERHWQDIFEVLGKKGLNCRLTDHKGNSGRLSEETVDKMRKPKTASHISAIKKAKAGVFQQKVKCDRCHKEGGVSNMKRYHFENCGKDHSTGKQVPIGPQPTVECPHCGVIGGINTLRQFHFDKCKTFTGIQLKRTVVECPHCKATGGSNLMKRWHFDNCKQLK
jgi:group I intron endonuclease